MPSELLASSPPPDIPDILQRFLAGESVQIMAKENHVHRDTIYRWMFAELGEEKYRELVTQVLVKRVGDADALLYDETYDIARAREIARFARMDLERRRPHLYGQKQTDSGTKILVLVNRDQAVKQLDTTTPSEQAEPE